MTTNELIDDYPKYSIMRFFAYDHLPPHLKAVSESFCELACEMAENLPGCAETSAGLRKLLEAKDCAVRAELTRPR